MDKGAEVVCVGDEDEEEGAGRRVSMTLTSMTILVATFSKKGRWAKAENVQVQVIGAIRKILGGKSSRIMTSINLASSYRNQGQ